MASLALVSTVQPVINYNGDVIGNFIVQVVPVGDDFAVNSDFYWTPCADVTVAYESYVDLDGVTVISPPPSYFSTTNNNLYLPAPNLYSLGQRMIPAEGYPLSDYTDTFPLPTEQGQTLYFYSGAWVVSSFDPSLTLPEAKTSLINTVRSDGASAVDTEVGLYSAVQLIDAPSVSALETKTYQPVTLGEYQTYVDDLIVSATATVNAATSTTALYSFNPAEIPFSPESGTSGVINIGRGANGALDLNPSNYVSFNSLTLTQSQTELYAPGTGGEAFYQGYPPNDFDYVGAMFVTGNYLIQIRETATSIVIAEFEVPLIPEGGTNQDISF